MESYRSIDELLNRRDVKRAEILIARYLRAELSVQERAALLIARARARLMTARADDALDDLHHARTLLPDDFDTPTTLELLGDAHFARFELASVGFADRNDTAQALVAYERIPADFPQYGNRGWIFYQRGRVYLTDNRIDDAVECFQRALLMPSIIPALTAYCYERLGFVAFYERRDFDQALGFLNKAAATYPTTEDRLWLVHVHTLRSRVYREIHHFDSAVDAANSAISVANSAEGKAGLPEALLSAAETLAPLDGREKDVIAHLQQYVQMSKKPLGIDVTWSRIHEMLGDAYYKTNQLQNAVSAYQASLQFNPYSPWEQSLYYRIARTLYQMSEYERAIQAIKTMMQSAEADGQPVSDYHAYQILGNSYFALKGYEQAMAAYQAALDIAPANADGLDKIRQYYQFAQDLSRPV
ncbi:MAG: tetratricopeptide repeat protein [Anaerolineae bacterium]|nr:tetratricopeptide repeat protein [Anaerolineae bacterium]